MPQETTPRTLATKSVAFDRYGSADVLAPRTVELPAPGPGQVRIAVRTAGVNPLDHKLRHGSLSDLFHLALPHVPGIEGAGVVEAVGPDVNELAVGDEVFGCTLTGSYAEYALAEVHRLARRPPTLGWLEAAAVPSAAETAVRCFTYLGLKAGETLLLHAAAGGVGTLAVQLAVARGIRVIGTASESNHAYLRALGAVPVTYGEDLAERVRAVAPQGVDAALDGAQRDGSAQVSIELTGGTERVVAIADQGDAARHGVYFSGYEDSDFAAAMAETLTLHRAGTLRLPVHRCYPLADAAEAQRESERGHLRGKLVLFAR
ncbi:NADP-dependent oxidoreductase [Streptomyces sp. NBC_01775]|uniref:NADP-dependent oxidoreductase n=1 Tax=Streptomyces sp. NBC_01775 TaxID=2975939 RepID=UPI002DD8710A|nr:NADP-dependent oxidoreductase [Streptomyces sp. NBC_01775]WSB77263.1 NADP-dependent oxidoreductase [Streptomyces sp. NBC_01775]